MGRIRSAKKTGILLAAFLALWCGCAQYRIVPVERAPTTYGPVKWSDEPLARFASAFVTYQAVNPANRIGTPKAVPGETGGYRIIVDPSEPVVYAMERPYTRCGRAFRNLIYRVHFREAPFSLIPFHLGAGYNTGLIVVVTLDAATNPILVTTVHTCGCYVAVIPTEHQARHARPDGWDHRSIRIYGEQLPGELTFGSASDPRLLVHLRPGEHRVMHVEVVEESVLHDSKRFQFRPAPISPMTDLESLSADTTSMSFYCESGILKGHVRGSFKIFETLFLGLVTLDAFVGSDKIYGDPQVTGNPFYTSLKPWNRTQSEMWDSGRFLDFQGWGSCASDP